MKRTNNLFARIKSILKLFWCDFSNKVHYTLETGKINLSRRKEDLNSERKVLKMEIQFTKRIQKLLLRTIKIAFLVFLLKKCEQRKRKHGNF